MHELAIMQNVLEVVLDFSEKNHAAKVHQINLVVGGLSDILSEWAQHYFDMISQGTIAENAKINISWIPAKVKCRACGGETIINAEKLELHCRKCESDEVYLVLGRGFKIASIEVT